MPVSVRLDAQLEDLVNAAARRTGQTRSEVIRTGVRAYCEEVLANGAPSHLDVWGDEIGRAAGARTRGLSRARDGERLLRERFRQLKHDRGIRPVRAVRRAAESVRKGLS